MQYEDFAKAVAGMRADAIGATAENIAAAHYAHARFHVEFAALASALRSQGLAALAAETDAFTVTLSFGVGLFVTVRRWTNNNAIQVDLLGFDPRVVGTKASTPIEIGNKSREVIDHKIDESMQALRAMVERQIAIRALGY